MLRRAQTKQLIMHLLYIIDLSLSLLKCARQWVLISLFFSQWFFWTWEFCREILYEAAAGLNLVESQPWQSPGREKEKERGKERGSNYFSGDFACGRTKRSHCSRVSWKSLKVTAESSLEARWIEKKYPPTLRFPLKHKNNALNGWIRFLLIPIKQHIHIEYIHNTNIALMDARGLCVVIRVTFQRALFPATAKQMHYARNKAKLTLHVFKKSLLICNN
jgi:hypothetical protein